MFRNIDRSDGPISALPALPALPAAAASALRAAAGAPAFDMIAVAASLGGLEALSHILSALPSSFPTPILIVQHLSSRFPSHLVELLSRRSALPVAWAQSGEHPRRGRVYVAPPDQHVRVSPTHALHLSREPRIQFVRPSADLLFSSIAQTYRERAIAVVLTGMRCDGANGARAIKRAGGRVLAQDPATARAVGMPAAAIATGCVDFTFSLPGIAAALISLTMIPGAAAFLQSPRVPTEPLLQTGARPTTGYPR